MQRHDPHLHAWCLCIDGAIRGGPFAEAFSVRACSILEILDETNAQWTWCAASIPDSKPPNP